MRRNAQRQVVRRHELQAEHRHQTDGTATILKGFGDVTAGLVHVQDARDDAATVPFTEERRTDGQTIAERHRQRRSAQDLRGLVGEVGAQEGRVRSVLRIVDLVGLIELFLLRADDGEAELDVTERGNGAEEIRRVVARRARVVLADAEDVLKFLRRLTVGTHRQRNVLIVGVDQAGRVVDHAGGIVANGNVGAAEARRPFAEEAVDIVKLVGAKRGRQREDCN